MIYNRTLRCQHIKMLKDYSREKLLTVGDEAQLNDNNILLMKLEFGARPSKIEVPKGTGL